MKGKNKRPGKDRMIKVLQKPYKIIKLFDGVNFYDELFYLSQRQLVKTAKPEVVQGLPFARSTRPGRNTKILNHSQLEPLRFA